MLLQLVNVLYVLVAIAMVALILMQRGAGAQAGSGFGGGASSTVFGARGASNFLSKSTKWLAIVFFVISMGMAMYASKAARQGTLQAAPDLGVMGQPVPQAAVPPAPVVEIPSVAPPSAPAADATPPPAQPAPPASQPAPGG
jgi:preprotein translocase subunit SecG